MMRCRIAISPIALSAASFRSARTRTSSPSRNASSPKSSRPVSRRAQSSSSSGGSMGHRPEEVPQVVDEELGLFHGGEVTATRHVAPVRDVVAPLDPRAREAHHLLGVARDAGGNRDVLRRARAGAVMLVLPVQAGRRRARLRAPSSSITLVSSWSRVKTFSGWPSQSLHVRNFSTIQASSPAGESLSATPSVCGLVDCSFA